MRVLVPEQTTHKHTSLFTQEPAPTKIYTLSLHDALPIFDTLKVKIISVTFRRVIRTNHKKASKIWRHENIQLGGCQSCRLFPRQIRANTISFTVFPEIVPSIGNSFINTMK